MTTAWFHVNEDKKKRHKVEFVKKKKTSVLELGEECLVFSPASPDNNHPGEVAAKAAALIEETVTSCEAAAST